jgi:hypothetical protein
MRVSRFLCSSTAAIIIAALCFWIKKLYWFSAYETNNLSETESRLLPGLKLKNP